MRVLLFWFGCCWFAFAFWHCSRDITAPPPDSSTHEAGSTHDTTAPIQESIKESSPSEERIQPLEESSVRPEPLVEASPEVIQEPEFTEPTTETKKPLPEQPKEEGWKSAFPIVTSCKVPEPASKDQIHLKKDVQYALLDKQRLLLDIAWPKKAGVYPLVVFIHGGSWRAGNKSSYTTQLTQLSGIGYVAASLNYRLAKAPKNIFPAAVQDVRCAIRWLRANAKTYSIDAKRVVAIGFSAGAHLTAMLGTSDTAKGLDHPGCPVPKPLPSVRLQGAIPVSGVYDLLLAAVPGQKPDPDVINFLGGIPSKIPKTAKLASPLYHLDPKDPPFLLFHGTADKRIPVAAARWFKIGLDGVSVPNTYVELPGYPHGYPMLSRQAKYQHISCTILHFLKTILRP